MGQFSFVHCPQFLTWDYINNLPCPNSGRMAFCLTPALSVCSLSHPCLQSLAPHPTPTLWDWFSFPYFPHCQWLVIFTVYVVQFCSGEGGSICLHVLLDYVPRSVCDAWCSSVGLAYSHRQIWNQTRKGKWWTAVPNAVAHWDCVQNSGEYVGFPQVKGLVCHRVQFCLILCLLLFEKEKGETARSFSQGRHTLVAVLPWDFSSY
jgi:hypothetical protein